MRGRCGTLLFMMSTSSSNTLSEFFLRKNSESVDNMYIIMEKKEKKFMHILHVEHIQV